MKLAAALPAIGLCAAGAMFLTAQGCSDSAPEGTGGSASKLPPAAEGSPTTATEERTYAVNTISLGESTRAGVKDADAWKQYGFNLDKLVSNVASTTSPDLAKLCKLADKAPATTHQDGDQGIDNAFGKKVITLLEILSPTPSKTVTDTIASGGFTMLFKVAGLTDDAAQTNTGLGGTLLVGAAFDPTQTDAPLKKKPTFTPADDWPYNKTPQVAISNAFINKGIFVNGSGDASIELTLSVGGQPLTLTINRAIISFKHTANDELAEGTIAGVIDTEAFVTGIGSIAGSFSKDFCQGSTIDGIKADIRKASDMISDGSQDPSKPCNGISIGLGFTAKRVANPTKPVDPPPAPAPACP